jgi:predicted ATPase
MVPAAGHRRLPLRGRTDELRLLDQLCDKVRSGESGSLVICGEAGVGKTALLHYVTERAVAEFRVAEIACV